MLQVFERDFLDGNVGFLEAKKNVQAMSKLVQSGSIPLSELGKLKAYMLNARSQGPRHKAAHFLHIYIL